MRLSPASGHLPYIERVLDNAFRGEKEITGLHCYGVLSSRIQVPCLLELIWSYWQRRECWCRASGRVARRFQNVRAPGDRDPLAHLEIDPLRPLGNLLWGYIQDEPNLLTVKRRAYEYDHQYGLTLYGKAVPALRPADSRSKFLEAFHHLLHRCSIFYKEDNDTTVIADGFSLLNALQEVHLLLAEGAHNQFGDLPWTARAEMLMQQWLLSRPEMRDFLQGRRMVPYKEPWMAQVDTMKALQGWTDIPRHPLPRPRRLWRADPADGPLWRLDRRQQRGRGQELGPLLAARDPGISARLPCRDRHGSDQCRHGRSHHAGHSPAEAAGDATGR